MTFSVPRMPNQSRQPTPGSVFCECGGAWPGAAALNRSALLTNTVMKPWPMVLLVWAACGLALAQASGDDESVKVITQPSGREVSGTNTSESIKLNLNVRLVRLPGTEAASLWRASSLGDRPASQHWIVYLSEQEARKQVAKWMATVGTSDLAQFSVTTLPDRTFEMSRATGSGEPKRAGVGGEPLAFLRATPTIDSDDGRRVHLEITAGITNGINAVHQLRRFSAPLTLWDGQTAVVGNPFDEQGRPADALTDAALLLLVSPVIVSGRD